MFLHGDCVFGQLAPLYSWCCPPLPFGQYFVPRGQILSMLSSTPVNGCTMYNVYTDQIWISLYILFGVVMFSLNDIENGNNIIILSKCCQSYNLNCVLWTTVWKLRKCYCLQNITLLPSVSEQSLTKCYCSNCFQLLKTNILFPWNKVILIQLYTVK